MKIGEKTSLRRSLEEASGKNDGVSGGSSGYLSLATAPRESMESGWTCWIGKV